MNMIQLEKTPENLWSYVKPPGSVIEEDELEKWLRTVIREGVNNLHIEDCFLQTIANLESDLVGQKYRVFIRPIAGMAASAEFFLERIP